MKLNGTLATCVVAVVAISASASAFAADGFAARFFGGQELTLGSIPALSRYASSDVSGLYGECAGCAANAASEAPIVDGFAYDYGYAAPGYVYDDFGFGDGFVYEDFWAPRRPFASVRIPGQPVRNILRGVRNFLCGGYNYCQPAYVCDPCWSVCDPCWSPCVDVCDPCGYDVCAAPVCDPCAPLSVFAPAGCCGYGVAPGETRELDPRTGVAANRGVDDPDVAVPAAKSNSTPDVISTEVQATEVPASRPATAAPATQNAPTFTEPESSETVPTPPADTLGVGVIRMLVPEDSVVFVNGYRTKQKGSLRSFAAKNLEYGESYTFEIRVVEDRNGKLYEDVQTTTLTAGDSTALAFNLTLRSDEAYAVNAR